MTAFHSYPTPAGAAHLERLGPHFTKLLLPDGSVNIFTEPDHGPAHDHPYPFVTHIVAGGYVEQVFTLHPDGSHSVETVERHPGTSHRVEAGTVHRIIHLPAGFCVTRTEAGAAERTSGFYQFGPGGIEHKYWHEADWHPYPR